MSSNEIKKIIESLECIANESTGRADIGKQMARDGITYSRDREREIIGQIADYMEKNGYTKKQISYYLSYDEDFIPDVLDELPRESVVNEDSSGVERMVAQFKVDARDHAKRIQQNGYRYSDSDYMEFFDDYSDLEELRDALQDYQTILQYVPSVDDDEATIKASIDKLAGMN